MIKYPQFIKVKLIIAIFILVVADIITACSYSKNVKDSKIVDMTVDYMTNPMNIDIIDSVPVFSWRMEDNTQGQLQSAYRIVVADSIENLEKEKYVWDSGKVESDTSVAIAYEGDNLLTGTEYSWMVYVWDKDNKLITSDDIATFETCIIDSDWEEAKWIGLDSYDNKGEMYVYPSQYTIEYDVKYNGEDGDSSFIWCADEGRYGNYYQCEIDTRNDEVLIKIGELDNGEYSNEIEALLTEDKESFNSSVHNIKIEVCNESVTAFVDGIEALSGEFESIYTTGALGLWTTRGTYYTYYDNIRISTTDDVIICDGDFNNESDNIFTPYYIKTVDGWCEADSGYTFTSGWEMPAPMVRYEFEVDDSKEVASARIYASALGIYNIYVNGMDISDEYMAPGQSLYTKEVYYRTYDITDCLNSVSDNAIGVYIGHGRYDRANESWGDRLAFIGKIVINYDDGTSDTYVTNDSWKVYDNGPIRTDDMYDGEYYDSNYELDGWSEIGFSTDDWKKATIYEEYDSLTKIPASYEPVKTISAISPVSVTEPVSGVYVYDFGQNFNGNCTININSDLFNEGDCITIRYSEWLNDDSLASKDDISGTIYTENLYTAKDTDYYIVSGKENEKYTPNFVFRGFRYVQITGLSGELPIEDVNGLVSANVISSDNEKTGSFTCSDDNINRLYNAIYWTQISNYVDIPTDCPQRDERLGWTGDTQVFARTASYNANIYTFMNKYIDLLRTCQSENGVYPEIVPSLSVGDAVNGWSDAGVILVWEMYQQYGNKELISKNLDAMCKYVDCLVATSDNYIRTKSGYSDHNAMSNIDNDIADTAQCAYVSLLLAKMCTAIGKNDIADKYMNIYESYKSAWQSAYINDNGSIGDWIQSSYVLGLEFCLYPNGLEQSGADCLNTSIYYSDYHLSTGYIATQFLLPILCDYGYGQTAYKILMQDTFPSWNDMLSRGNTTINEGWMTMYDCGDGTYAISGSLNHMALGSVGQWMYEYMLGIKRDENSPAFKHFYIEPVVSKELEYAQGSYKSMYGEIKSSWKIEGNEIIYDFTIPANTTATVSLDADGYNNMNLGAGTYQYRIPCN